jgi:ABC-type phosphate transport system substrate-binding protein
MYKERMYKKRMYEKYVYKKYMHKKHIYNKCVRLLAAFLLQTLAVTANAGDIIVIVSASNQAGALRPDQVADIFLGQIGHFPDGTDVLAIDQGIGSLIRDEFYVKVVSKTPPLVKAYWSKMSFTGRAQPPKELPDSIAIRKLVAANPNLIGYIDRSALDSSIKAILQVH